MITKESLTCLSNMSDVKKAIKILEKQSYVIIESYLDDDGVYSGKRKGTKEDIELLEANEIAIAALEFLGANDLAIAALEELKE